MIDYTQVAKLIVEEIANDKGVCFYPAGFKPPHKGHFKAAKALADRSYITEVVVIIGKKPEDGITPEESLKIWQMYLKAEPNPEIKPRLSTSGDSPVDDVFAYLKEHPNVDVVYVAGGEDETDDQAYMDSLKEQYPNTVKTIPVQEKDGRVSSMYVRDLLKYGDYESFKETIPEAAYNKGFAKDIFKMLVKTDDQTQPASDKG